ncbi:fructokinase [Parabacteroides sp. PFB2-12]|uniref:carbohydrate kinase family protein n=1 Tax=unclassified Parabacteroides TaxID=2649774 RepID=UPI002476E3D9|nr:MULTISPECIES: carbohydrate kinase [unclassified Parabacteroides]MDH6343228.1 fructokinase [Parabacteroides sp. PM6-13]MDH6392146.1 fructokinase [Parabacteroides sp. PFB2-12]
MRKVIGIGETILDIIFKDDQPHRAIPGGTVFNGFVSLARMGVPLCFISELGNDPIGDIIRRFMQENGLSTDYIDAYPDGKSPLALAFLDEEQNASYMVYKDYPAQRLDVGFPTIQENDIFIVGSYYALNPAVRERVAEFLQYARDRKAIIYYDPNFRKPHAHEALRLRPALIENLEYADIVRGSDEDFFWLYGEKDMEKIYEQHIRFYCERLICTHGSKGVTIFSKNNREHFPTPCITPVSTVGAGDNFNAGFIYGLLKYHVTHDNLNTLDKTTEANVMRCAIDFAAEACKSYDNYISQEFAESYR